MAVIDTSAQRAESAIWLYDRTANVTVCGQSCAWLRARSGDRRRAACPALR
jgi:hypothetical protein